MQNIERRDHAALVSSLQDVRIAVKKLRDYPLFNEFQPGLVMIGLPKDRTKRGGVDGIPNTTGIFTGEEDWQLCNVRGNARDAGIDRRGREQEVRIPNRYDVALPCACSRFTDWSP